MHFQSMTGFGKGEIENERYRLSVEVKSVNHRFKDIRLKLGSVFNAQEIKMRKKIEELFIRGSFDVFVLYKKNTTASLNTEFDYNKINKFIDDMKKNIPTVNFNISLSDFFKPDFYLEETDKEEELTELLFKAYEQALIQLRVAREGEGASLVRKLTEHMQEYKVHFAKVVQQKNSYQEIVKDKLIKKFNEEASDLKIDEPRFLQEVVFHLEKLDIDEEVNRINIHLSKLEQMMNSESNEIGREIDFLVQELNRETNTIGSKSGNGEISQSIVQMKLQLEKIREQALNLQ